MAPSPLSHGNEGKGLNLVGVCKAEAKYIKNYHGTVKT